MIDKAIAIFALFLGCIFGDIQGDNATLKDCAVHGQAHMAGGGTIKCEVLRELLK